jgi:hypothetical protein
MVDGPAISSGIILNVVVIKVNPLPWTITVRPAPNRAIVRYATVVFATPLGGILRVGFGDMVFNLNPVSVYVITAWFQGPSILHEPIADISPAR